MKKLGKYLILGAVVAFGATMANAEITVKDTVSPEFIHNQGYSDEVSRVISVKTKDPMTPIAQEENSKGTTFRYYLWNTLDPEVDRPGRWVNHNTKFKNTIEEL